MARAPTAMVLAPSPLLTITIEATSDGRDELHLHAGGQGFWIARMLRVLGLDVSLCAPFGGEIGTVLRGVIAEANVQPCGVTTTASNGAYVHDRRGGERREVARHHASPLSRHEVDDMYGLALTEGLDADVCVLGGPDDASVIPAEVYRRLTADLVNNDRTVIVDLSGEPLRSALAGGVTIAKVSEEDLLRDGHAKDGDSVPALLEAITAAGAHNVIMTRGHEPAVALLDGQVREIRVPTLHPIDSHGAGDALTAGVAAAMARGATVEDAVRLGAAAGSLNVTRRGLASGSREQIERMATHVVVGSTAR